MAKIGSTLANDTLQQDDPCRSLNTQVSLVDKALQWLQYALSCSTVSCHLGHEGAPFELPPVVQAILDLIERSHPHSVTGFQ